ncbi:SapC family protein [Terrihabitans rhizophilus]|uniref:SapC family protein n=1 Tax=Terrihabitans rhizophilus TaxID=3092662 RepID=A0ABU4RLY6_9HYPH|nr:SapC family protein [Terrihabitans sp. PJ23]MDX6805812.1 SapC family protein [Terrihabitans sp. PJ23]
MVGESNTGATDKAQRQLLIYERAVPVSRQRHADWSVKAGQDYSFASSINSVPLMTAEFNVAMPEFAIVFAGQGDQVVPVAMLGVRDQENLYVSRSGGWTARYIPAFLRRYPFVFASTDAGDNFTLCIDEDFSGANTEGRGERLFDSTGERTQYLQGVLGFLQAYQQQFLRTQAFTRRLVEFDLLEPMQAQFTLPGGQRMTLTGFQAISAERLKALSGERLEQLARADELDLIYAHLHSLRNFTPTAERVREHDAQAEGAPETAEPARELAEQDA